jgi:NAD(P)-dependent dehydrogenase (short-subunit alcohol dehydrogenase family)
MSDRLAEKVAIITGGGSGIGRATALRFAAEGAAVVCADISLENAARTVHEVESAGGRALAVAVDTSQEEQCEAMVARTVEAYGAVDVLVAAAGISSAVPRRPVTDPPISILDFPLEPYRRVMEVNFYGVYFSDRAAARWMRATRRPGSIINLASIAAKMPLIAGGGAYSVSKAAVWMLTKQLARELAPLGIRVNAIGPGYIDTPMTAPLSESEEVQQVALAGTPMARMGRPEEVAATALFLASDDSSYFTGELLHPSGGMFVG